MQVSPSPQAALHVINLEAWFFSLIPSNSADNRGFSFKYSTLVSTVTNGLQGFSLQVNPNSCAHTAVSYSSVKFIFSES